MRAVQGESGAEGWRLVGACCEGRAHLLLAALVHAGVHPAAWTACAACTRRLQREVLSVVRRVRVTLPLHYRYITVTSPLHHRYITITSPLHHRYITVTLLSRARTVCTRSVRSILALL